MLLFCITKYNQKQKSYILLKKHVSMSTDYSWRSNRQIFQQILPWKLIFLDLFCAFVFIIHVRVGILLSWDSVKNRLPMLTDSSPCQNRQIYRLRLRGIGQHCLNHTQLFPSILIYPPAVLARPRRKRKNNTRNLHLQRSSNWYWGGKVLVSCGGHCYGKLRCV